MFAIDTFNLGSPLGEKSGLEGLTDATGVVVAVTLLVAAIRSLLDEIKRL
jgi:hypothetical protein